MATTWKEALAGKLAEPLEREIDIFETQIALRKQGRIEEKLFAETRLRRGAYGQRYDNGQRHDGATARAIAFPSGDLTKGPQTLWDAPGMQRIKIPFGALTPEQMEALAEVAEEYSDAILHITTRQDVQLHFVHIEDTPSIMRRLGAAGITTREACGNTVRNVTACPYAGVCADEPFDVSPYAKAAASFMLGHEDAQDFGRKFKIAFSGCADAACGLTQLHDFGATAQVREDGGVERRGFHVVVGGGLGLVPHQAKTFAEHLPEEELLPTVQALGRVFARLGEKKNRQRARLKFLVQKLGLDELKRLVEEERAKLPKDARWTSYLDGIAPIDRPLKPAAPLPPGSHGAAFDAWKRTNVRPQRQPGYSVATVRLPLGDLTSDQMRALADLARRFVGAAVRTTVEQNIVFRWVSDADLPALHQALVPLGLGAAGAGTIADVTACPGTDTCKLGISSSRGLAAELGRRFDVQNGALPDAIARLHVKTSGCFNACGQHHIADLGFLGVSRNVGGRRVPHFQVVLGGQEAKNAGAYGLAIGAVPSKRVPEVVDRLTRRFVDERVGDETFQAFIQRTGKGKVRALLDDLIAVPSYADDPSSYSDWGDPREYTIGDMAEGECAGEVVPLAAFGLAAAEREAFEAQLALDGAEAGRAADLAYRAMLTAAKALVKVEHLDVGDAPEDIVREFRARLVDTKRFADPFAGDKFAQYLLRLHESLAGGAGEVSAERAHQRIEEAQLFIEAAHACYDRMQSPLAAG